jgi:ABC-type Fe3+/spermidine/putrescine transport system ATPase subunit
MIRPERFRVAADAEGSAAGSDGLPGVVQETIYVGEFRKYTVRINGTETLSVRQPNQSGAAAWRPKDRVRLSVDPGDVRIV